MKWVAICSIVRHGVCMNEKRTYFSIIKVPNVEVTGAARLYRAASVWTAVLGQMR